jgi:hypothetical protein
MKILITGMNKNQVTENFYLRQQLCVVPSHYSLIRCLRDMGHTVEQRLVKIGEDLGDYDEVIVFLASPRQALQLAFYNGLWAISRRPNCILAFDDWQVEDIYKGIASCTDEESLLKEFTINQNKMTDPECSLELLKPHVDSLLSAVGLIAQKKNRLLLSLFAGGDPSLLIDYPKDRIFAYNPNPYHRNRVPGDRGDIPLSEMSFMEQQTVPSEAEDTIDPAKKERKFNFASLVQGKTAKWLKKQKVSKWEIEFFGSRKDGQRRLGESEMCLVYAQQWGCLMPGYAHAGSGWWRARPLQLADAGSILIGEPKEMELYYGKGNSVSYLTAGQVESMHLKELTDAAHAQRVAFYLRHPLVKDVQQMELNRVFKAS